MNLLRRTWQGVLNSVAEGIIQVIDDSGPVQTAQITIGTLERRDNTPILYNYGYAARPPIGTRCCLNFTAGDRSLGVVIATSDTVSRPRNLGDGEVMIYDETGTQIHFKAGGNIEITTSAKVKVTAPVVEVIGSVYVSGDIYAAGAITATGNITAHAPHVDPP